MANMISIDKIDEMYDVYLERQSVAYLMSECSVSKGTARKYINSGDPGRGIESFKARYLALSSKKQKKSEKTFEDKAEIYRQESLAMVRKFKGMIAKLLTDIKAFDPSSVSPMKMSMILESIPKIEAFLNGQATERVEHNHVHTASLDLPPEKMAQVARIILTHRQEQADVKAVRDRQLAENKIAVAEGRFGDVMEVVDAEFNAQPT
ncbi:MAG: hypothetical protein V3V74_07415 [Nitrosomonadaceae bacterium]